MGGINRGLTNFAKAALNTFVPGWAAWAAHNEAKTQGEYDKDAARNAEIGKDLQDAINAANAQAAVEANNVQAGLTVAADAEAAARGTTYGEMQSMQDALAADTAAAAAQSISDQSAANPDGYDTGGYGTGDTSGGFGEGQYAYGGLTALAQGGLSALAQGGMYNLGGYSDGGRLLRGPGDGVSDSIPAMIGKKQPARLADGEFVVPARIVSELGNGSTEAGARKLYAMMDRIQAARRSSIGKGKVAKNSRADKYLPA